MFSGYNFQQFKKWLKHAQHEDHLLRHLPSEKYKMSNSELAITLIKPQSAPLYMLTKCCRLPLPLAWVVYFWKLWAAMERAPASHQATWRDPLPEERAGSKSSCGKSQLAALQGAEETRSHFTGLTMSSRVWLYKYWSTTPVLFSVCWFCWFF